MTTRNSPSVSAPSIAVRIGETVADAEGFRTSDCPVFEDVR
jgi:hypothetical protein